MKCSQAVAVTLLGLWSGAAACSAVSTVPAVATTESAAERNRRVVPPPGTRVATEQEEANKRIVLQWHYEFFDLGQFESASNKYLAEDFQQNDPREPSGRANYVNNFKGNGYVPKKPAERPPLIAVLADGELVMTVIPEGWDGKTNVRSDGVPIHCNLYRVVDGRIRAMWVSGGSGGPPQAPPAAGPAR